MTEPSTTCYLLEYVDKIGESSFIGDRISDMSRDELLGLIGWMHGEMDRMNDRHKREVDMERAFRRASKPSGSKS